MKINFNSADCMVDWMHEKRLGQFANICDHDHRLNDERKVNEEVPPSLKVYFSGIKAGLTCAAFTLAGRVSAVAENALKGLGNILGAPFSKECHAWTGIKQLAGGLPLSVLKLLFVMPLEILRDVAATPVCVAIDKRYAISQAYFEGAFFMRRNPYDQDSYHSDDSSSEVDQHFDIVDDDVYYDAQPVIYPVMDFVPNNTVE